MLVGFRDTPLVIGHTKTLEFSLPVLGTEIRRDWGCVHHEQVVMTTAVLDSSGVVICKEEVDRVWVGVATDSIHQLENDEIDRITSQWSTLTDEASVLEQLLREKCSFLTS